MPLKVITPEDEVLWIHSPQDFEKIFKITYLPHLEFANTKTQFHIEKLCDKAFNKGWITAKQKWQGHYYAKSLRGALYLDLTIAWIDSVLGYGVFTNRDLPAHFYIGEYTGILRKRRFFGRWSNLYCFTYAIREGKSSSYVIDAQDFGNHTRFINHSEEANLEPISVYCDGLLHVILHTKTAIPAGTQLCYDYGADYWKKREKPRRLSDQKA